MELVFTIFCLLTFLSCFSTRYNFKGEKTIRDFSESPSILTESYEADDGKMSPIVIKRKQLAMEEISRYCHHHYNILSDEVSPYIISNDIEMPQTDPPVLVYKGYISYSCK